MPNGQVVSAGISAMFVAIFPLKMLFVTVWPSKFYSGEQRPHVPTEFLYAMWISSRQLAGYAQQDAHEFFIGVLNGIHASCELSTSHGSSVRSPLFLEDSLSESSALAVPVASSYSFPADPHACHCIVHQVFAGTFLSTVTCLQCGNQNGVHDPFLDISLDLRPPRKLSSVLLNKSNVSKLAREKSSTPSQASEGTTERSISPGAESSSSFGSSVDTAESISDLQSQDLGNGKSATHALQVSSSTSAPGALGQSEKRPSTLQDCLDRFTHSETLSSSEYKCGLCRLEASAGTTVGKPTVPHGMGATKQLLIKKLPLVLSFQLKRFEHALGGTHRKSHKIDTMISFPMNLDMTPYTTIPARRQTSGARRSHVETVDGELSQDYEKSASNSAYLYTLFAVVEHQGTLQSGHYTCFVRQSGGVGQWFKFDDHMVTLVEWEQVQKSQA
jgi:ubiquitin carboxyl-terminal hydrolase 22/27/51